MMRYRVTLTAGPNAGHSTTVELNEAAAADHRRRGYHLEALGLSRISQRVNAVKEAAVLLAREDITDDQYSRATGLMRQYGITSDDLNAYHAMDDHDIHGPVVYINPDGSTELDPCCDCDEV